MARGEVARAAVVALMVARCCMPLAQAAPVLDPDMDALEDLASAWSSLDGSATWSRGTDCDSMAAVYCDDDGHVVALYIKSSELTGSLPPALFTLPNLVHVVLSGNQLTGNIPDTVGSATGLQSLLLDANQLSGTLPSSLGSLSALVNLILSTNGFSGSIPNSLSKLTSLEYLYLDANALSGSIPAFISNSPGLKHLTMGLQGKYRTPWAMSPTWRRLDALEDLASAWSSLDGSATWSRGTDCDSMAAVYCDDDGHVVALEVRNGNISASIPESITALEELSWLYIKSSELTGSLPPALFTLPNLVHVVLSGNQLTGNIPDTVGSATGLQSLLLDANQLSGTLPSSLGSLSALVNLILSTNGFSGSIPNSLSKLTSLEYLYLDANALSGSIPAFISNSPGLKHLTMGLQGKYRTPWAMSPTWRRLDALEDLASAWSSLDGSATWSRGTDCDSMAAVYCDDDGHVVALEVRNGNISASIPESITALEELSWLYIKSSELTGSLPPALFTLPNLVHVVLSGNQLTGNIPDTVGSATGLQSLLLDANQLSGTLPSSLGSLSALVNLILSTNGFSGSIPNSLSKLTSLEYLYLDANALSGSIPAFISNSPGLKHLVLQYNGFTGQIPDSLGNVTNLEALSVRANHLTGPIPPSLGNCTRLIELDVGLNNISGTIPATLGSLRGLKYLYMVDNLLSGSLPNELSSLQQLKLWDTSRNYLSMELPAWIGSLTNMTVLSLGYNRFNGSIPEALGNLHKLTYLTLDYNMFSGSIPESLGDMTALEALFLDDNWLFGTIPASLVNLNRLTTISLSDNYLLGTIPAAFSTLTRLVYLPCTPLVGKLPSLKLMPSLKAVAARSNFLTGAAEAPPPCPTYQLLLHSNCFARNLTICSTQQTMKEAGWCKWFCGIEPMNPPCSGHGVCYSLPEIPATCACDYGYQEGTAADTCVPRGPYIPSDLSSYSHPMALFQSASSAPNGSIFLSSAPSTASWGAAFTQQPIALFLPTARKAPCYQPIAFFVSFAFRMTPAAASTDTTAGEGLAFVVTSAAPQGAAAIVGLGGVGRRSVGVEFDSVLSVKHSDPNDNHVGVNVGGSPVSLASATAPLILNDAQTKHAWIHYDPTSGGTLRVFLSASRQQPSKPLLTARVSLCSVLKPTVGDASFFFGFVAASASRSQQHDILWWNIVTGVQPAPDWQNQAPGRAFGQVASAQEVAAGSEGDSVPSSFHYASLFFRCNVSGLPSWDLPPSISWMQDESTWPVMNQHGCADSSAFAVVAAVEAAYSIASGWSQPPRLSVEALRVALSSNCDDMSPRDVLAFLAAATRKGGGLVDEAAAAGASQRSMASAGRRERLQKPKYYGIVGFEETSFGGWLGLLLAVQRQPVVVRIEASAPSFLNYDGTYTYADSSCFQEGVNHAVLLVGYALEDSSSWLIRNSWGSGWGNAGHMLIKMQSGPGICGINTLPGLFPIIKVAADPCGSKSMQLPTSSEVAETNAFNPCGQFKCSKSGSSNRCACAAPHFVEALHSDGSKTCAYVDACGLASSNPCVVGTCVNDGRGSYSCVCPPGFIQGTTANGTLSCAPGDSKGSFTVLGSNVRCSHLLPVLGLTLEQLKQQNKKLSCTKPIPVNSKVNVKPPLPLPRCSLFYTTQPEDSCASIAALFGLTTGCPVEGEACGEAVVGLNPGLDCAALTGSQAVCVEREESKAGVVAVCEQQYELQGSGGCDAARMAVDPPLSPLEFHRLNPGINCNTRLPTDSVEGYSRRKVCISSNTSYKIATCPGGSYRVAAGDSCAMIDVKGFSSIRGCYRKLNGFECLEKMIVGTTVCTPTASSARVGICSMVE
ncbi:hypothetical protein CLOP_g14333 [Closterium sp. NIES-67]|nr:hypothetical protein CLOP_g14333 [Closterium sp. NIES-67]